MIYMYVHTHSVHAGASASEQDSEASVERAPHQAGDDEEYMSPKRVITVVAEEFGIKILDGTIWNDFERLLECPI